MGNDLEKLFFESTIIDIDLSKWDSYIQMCVICRWTTVDEMVVPSNEIILIKFKNVTELSMKFRSAGPESQNRTSAGINVGSAVYYKNNKSIKFEASFFDEFLISFDDVEIEFLDGNDELILSKISLNNGVSFLRPDIKAIANFFRKGKPGDHDHYNYPKGRGKSGSKQSDMGGK